MNTGSITWRQFLGFEVRKGNRKEPRYPSSEKVAIVLQPGFGDVSATVQGEFVDRSKSGCRIRHRLGSLRATSEVAVVWIDDHKRARVIWNKCEGDVTETGLQFID